MYKPLIKPCSECGSSNVKEDKLDLNDRSLYCISCIKCGFTMGLQSVGKHSSDNKTLADYTLDRWNRGRK